MLRLSCMFRQVTDTDHAIKPKTGQGSVPHNEAAGAVWERIAGAQRREAGDREGELVDRASVKTARNFSHLPDRPHQPVGEREDAHLVEVGRDRKVVARHRMGRNPRPAQATESGEGRCRLVQHAPLACDRRMDLNAVRLQHCRPQDRNGRAAPSGGSPIRIRKAQLPGLN